MRKYILYSLLLLSILACSSINNEPYRFFVNEINPSSPIESRILPVPESVISWLNEMDVTDNYSYKPAQDEELLFVSYLQLLPEKYQRIIEEKVIVTGLTKFGAIVGDNVEIGCNTILNPGTIIGRNTMIYPLSSIKGYIEPNSIVKLIQVQQSIEKK